MAAEDSTWDVIVIGMGVMGSSTAYFLAKEHGKVGERPLLSFPCRMLRPDDENRAACPLSGAV